VWQAGEEREETEEMAYREREFVGSVHSLFGHSNGRLREGRDLLSHLKGDLEELWRRMRRGTATRSTDLRFGNNFANKSISLSLLGIDHVACKDHLHRLATSVK
jgi:hypothetical protein